MVWREWRAGGEGSWQRHVAVIVVLATRGAGGRLCFLEGVRRLRGGAVAWWFLLGNGEGEGR